MKIFDTLIKADGTVEVREIEVDNYIDDVRASKVAEMSDAAEQAIKVGIDVTTAYGLEHFSLDTFDQINVSNLSILLATGVTGYLYHADGKACVMYSAADLQLIIQAALQWVTYHTTYHNFMKVWINRETDISAIQGITYGTALPADLQADMDALLALVGGGA